MGLYCAVNSVCAYSVRAYSVRAYGVHGSLLAHLVSKLGSMNESFTMGN